MFGLMRRIENEIERLQQRQNLNLARRNLRDNSNPFELPDAYFIKLFRVNKELCRDICEILIPHMHMARRTTAIPSHLKILLSLNFFGHGSYQTPIGTAMSFPVSQPTVSRAITEVSEIICNVLLHRQVVFPIQQHHIDNIKEGFLQKFAMSNVIGCIDGTHVAIISPPMEHPIYPGAAYYNRKGYTSINVQIICDSSLKVTAINARYPGSTHDAAIWQTSWIQQNLKERYLDGETNTWLLGDSGYPLQPWLLTPVNDAPENTPEGRYTAAHCSCRNTVERTIGVLKSRFRCLYKHRVLHYSPPKAGIIIYACAALHNMCIDRNINNDDEELIMNEVEQDDHPVVDMNQDFYNQGLRVRQQLIQNTYV